MYRLQTELKSDGCIHVSTAYIFLFWSRFYPFLYIEINICKNLVHSIIYRYKNLKKMDTSLPFVSLCPPATFYWWSAKNYIGRLPVIMAMQLKQLNSRRRRIQLSTHESVGTVVASLGSPAPGNDAQSWRWCGHWSCQLPCRPDQEPRGSPWRPWRFWKGEPPLLRSRHGSTR